MCGAPYSKLLKELHELQVSCIFGKINTFWFLQQLDNLLASKKWQHSKCHIFYLISTSINVLHCSPVVKTPIVQKIPQQLEH